MSPYTPASSKSTSNGLFSNCTPSNAAIFFAVSISIACTLISYASDRVVNILMFVMYLLLRNWLKSFNEELGFKFEIENTSPLSCNLICDSLDNCVCENSDLWMVSDVGRGHFKSLFFSIFSMVCLSLASLSGFFLASSSTS